MKELNNPFAAAEMQALAKQLESIADAMEARAIDTAVLLARLDNVLSKDANSSIHRIAPKEIHVVNFPNDLRGIANRIRLTAGVLAEGELLTEVKE